MMKTRRDMFLLLVPVAMVVWLPMSLNANPATLKPKVAHQPLFPLIKIGGQVIGPNGKPVKGAQVALFCGEGSLDAKPQIAFTDAAGKFTFSVSKEVSSAPSKVIGHILVLAPNLATTKSVLKKTGNVIHLQAGRTISGKVVDEAGKPVAGAQVRLLVVTRDQDSDESLDLMNIGALRERFASKSAANGGWTIGGLPKEGQAWVQLDDPAYAHLISQKELGDVALLKPLVAKPAARLAGRVLLSSGKPAVGVLVSVSSGTSSGGMQTDKNGRYAIGGLDGGNFSLSARDLSGEWVASEVKGINVQNGQTSQVPDIVLGRGFLVEGMVLDADTGAPVRGVEVGAQGEQGFARSTISDAKGHLIFP